MDKNLQTNPELLELTLSNEDLIATKFFPEDRRANVLASGDPVAIAKVILESRTLPHGNDVRSALPAITLHFAE